YRDFDGRFWLIDVDSHSQIWLKNTYSRTTIKMLQR
ncbi:hypothetical protein MGSAQ_001372, partial [marine sediment metagenome]